MVRELPRGREVQFDQSVKSLPEGAIRPIEAVKREARDSDILAEFGGDLRPSRFAKEPVREAYLERPRSLERTEQAIMGYLERAYERSRIRLTFQTRTKLENILLRVDQLEELRSLSDYELERYADELVAVWGQKQKIWERAVRTEMDEGRLAAK